MDTIAQKLARNVAERRTAQKRSLQDIADLAGISKSHVWEIERGNAPNPTVSTLLALARAFGCEPLDLIEDFAEPPLHPLAMRVAVDVDRAFRIANGKMRLPDAAE